MMLLLLGACATEPLDTALVPLSGPRLLRRMSLDLRGTLPSVAELDRAESADEAEMQALRDALLDDPAFEERLVLKLAERWHTRVDDFLLKHVEYPELAAKELEYPWERSVGEEPLRVMAHVVAEDRAWQEVVTGSTTMASPEMMSSWPLERLDDAEGWGEARYLDGRPAAGVLATNGLWWRYYSTVSNYNRGRAAVIARLLLCEDFLARPVELSGQVALVDADGIQSALANNPYCLGCHAALDPMASALFGFWVANEYNAVEMESYHPEREQLGQTLIGHAPGYYGLPVDGLGQLGEQIAADPRFWRCAAESFAGMYWAREPGADDFERIDALRGALVADGRVKPMLRVLTDGEVYRAGGHGPDADEAQLAAESTARLMDAVLYASVYEDLAALRWVEGGADQLDNDTTGFRVLGGGVDGNALTAVQATPSLTWVLTTQRAAEAAAAAVAATLGTPDAPERVFQHVDGGDVPGDAAFTAELDALHWRLYAVRADAAWREEAGALWAEVAATSDPETAWTALLAAMFQDPLFVTY